MAVVDPSCPRLVTKVGTTEQPTFFGPAQSPLFGVLHLPSDRRVREGVLLCSSLGKEAADSVRFQRILAEDLASRGFAVLRFDYLGTGDSAFAQTRENAVSNWVHSVAYAAEYLKSIGITGISVIAHRIGCLIAEVAVRETGSKFERVVFIDPVLSGRLYLREQSALFKIAVGIDATPPGTVSIVGALIAGGAAKELSALALGERLADTERLFVLRAGEGNARVRAIVDGGGIAHTNIQQLNSTLSLPMPLAAADEIVSWFDQRAPSAPATARPLYQLRARMPGEDADSGGVVETIEEIGPKGLFAIRSTPDGQVRRSGMVVLFCATSIDPHIGPTREWVEMGRRIAADGHEALRWDREGLGNSPPVQRNQWPRIYRRAEIADVIAAAKHANPDPAGLCAVGVCSGSWYSAHAACSGMANHVVLINPILWSWRAHANWTTEWLATRRLMAPVEAQAPRTARSVSASRLAETAARTRHLVRRGLQRYMPRPFALLSCWLGISLVPEAVLSRLARSLVRATVVLGPEDAEIFKYRRGPDALRRLQHAATQPVVVTVDRGDHAAFHQAILQEARRVVLDVLANCPRESVTQTPLPTAVPTRSSPCTLGAATTLSAGGA